MAEPVRAWCHIHEAHPERWCTECRTAIDLSTWWAHDQDRCVPSHCPHCARMALNG